MKALMLLVVLGTASQNLGQASKSAVGSIEPGASAEQELGPRLVERARLLYGPDFAKTLIFTSRVSPLAEVGPKVGPAKPTRESPFTGSDYEESTRPMSQKGDVASGVVLLEERDVLYLDLTPCRVKSTVFEFHSPFVKKRLGTLDCDGKQIDRFLVAQR